MPKWFTQLLLILLVIALIVGAAVFLINYLGSFMKGITLPSINPNQPTLDTTLVYQYTPTFGADDVEHLLATAMPTPRAILTEPEIKAMNKALENKNVFLTTDDLYGAKYIAMNASYYCTDIKVFNLSLPWSNIGASKFIEGKWQMGVSLGDITFTVEKGSKTTPVYHEGNGKPYIETKFNGILVINIAKFGIDGPTYLKGNEWLFGVDGKIPGYELWLIPRQFLTGYNLVEEKRLNVANMAQLRVKYDTLAPNGSDENLMNLYKTFKQSFTEPGDGHLYDSFITLFGPLARENGFAGIEGIKVNMPPAPSNIYSWTDMDGAPLIPANFPQMFADSTCPKDKPSAADIEWMGKQPTPTLQPTKKP